MRSPIPPMGDTELIEDSEPANELDKYRAQRQVKAAGAGGDTDGITRMGCYDPNSASFLIGAGSAVNSRRRERRDEPAPVTLGPADWRA